MKFIDNILFHQQFSFIENCWLWTVYSVLFYKKPLDYTLRLEVSVEISLKTKFFISKKNSLIEQTKAKKFYIKKKIQKKKN